MNQIKTKSQKWHLMKQMYAFENFYLRKMVPKNQDYEGFVFDNFGKWHWFRAYLKTLSHGKFKTAY